MKVVRVFMFGLVLSVGASLGLGKASAQTLSDLHAKNGINANIAANEYVMRIVQFEPELARATTAMLINVITQVRKRKHQALLEAGLMTKRQHYIALTEEANQLIRLTSRLGWQEAEKCHKEELKASQAAYRGEELTPQVWICRVTHYAFVFDSSLELLDRLNEPDMVEIFEGMPLAIEQAAASAEFMLRQLGQ